MSERSANSLSLRSLAVIVTVMAGVFWLSSHVFNVSSGYAGALFVLSVSVLIVAISVSMNDRPATMLLAMLAVVLLTSFALGAVITYLVLVEHQALLATWLVLYVAQAPVHFVFAIVYHGQRCRLLAQVHLAFALLVLGYNLAAGNPLVRRYDALLPPLMRASQQQRD